MQPNLKLAGSQKKTRTTVDTVLLTPQVVETWKAPPFQRPKKINAKVHALVDTIKEDGGVLPGILTLGVFEREKYIVDGQHRVEAWKLSGLTEGYADVRTCYFDSLAEMGQEFVTLNSSLVSFRPDDKLRGLEASSKHIQVIRERCPFVGYDYIRRNDASPLVSMSVAIRMWASSAEEVPASVPSALTLADRLSDVEVDGLCRFLNICYQAWGKDVEYQRLWANLNITLCAYIFRRMVLATPSKVSRVQRMTFEQFQKCMMALSAEGTYLDWLTGRSRMSDRDRSPAFQRIKAIFTRRLYIETNEKRSFLQPAWAARAGR